MKSRYGISRKTSNKIVRHSTSSGKSINVKPPLYRGGIRF